MEKDVFCKIIDGEIPCYKIYEDEDVLAFLDISQVTKGHALVVPKEHYDTFLSCPDKLMHKVMDVAQRIGQISIQFLGAKGVNILTNCRCRPIRSGEGRGALGTCSRLPCGPTANACGPAKLQFRHG